MKLRLKRSKDTHDNSNVNKARTNVKKNSRLISNKSSTKLQQCIFCKKKFKGDRGLSIHIRSCKGKNLIEKISSPGSDFNVQQCTNIDIDTSIRENGLSSTEQPHKNNNNNITNDTISEQLLSTNNNQSSVIPHHTGTTFHASEIDENMVTNNNYSTEQAVLYTQENNFRKKMGGSNSYWPINDLAKLELLKTLNRHGCPNVLYDDVMKWAKFYSHKQGLTLFDDLSIQRRSTFLKQLIEKRDLQKLQPISKSLFFNDRDMEVKVTTFDFKQQVLSMLRDKDLMQPGNLVLDKPGSIPNFDTEYISEIQDALWYKTASKYYNDKYGLNDRRVICGVILTIDKTHTDSKGKLCLEPVDFSLSLFNKKTRRTMRSAWRTLGFINDLDATFYEDIFADDTNFSNHNNIDEEVL